MGVIDFSDEFVSPVAPARFFKAAVLDMHKISPKLMPAMVKSGAIVEGDGGVGSIIQFNFTEAIPFAYVKDRIDVLDKEKLVCKYTLIEGGELGTKLKSASYEVKFEEGKDGGTICKMETHYQTLDGVDYKQELKAAKESTIGMFKTIEAHLSANPNEYA